MLEKLRFWMHEHWFSFLILLIINLIVLTNSILQGPKVGYDVTLHLKYIQVLPLRLPTSQDTGEYFSAPLPYFIPSLFDKICVGAKWGNCVNRDGKFAQILNFFLSVGITVLLWKLAQLLRPGSEPFKIALFAMLGILTVYYRTFSQPRGEPYVAFFTVFVFYWLFKMIRQPLSIRWKDGLVLGIALGLLILSRQWGFLIFPALAFPVILIFCKNRRAGVIFGRNILLAGLVAFLVGGWFYIHLYVQYGSFSAFNMNTTGFSFSNQPLSFYRNLHLKGFELFTQPVRPNFDNTLLPIFYSDTWGDYWDFFTYILRNSVPVATRQEMAAYLGRVNLVSIFPSLIFLAGLAGGGLELVKSIRKKEIDPQATFQGFIFLAILFSWIGYMWFLISYPNPPTGNTNKATYMIQIFVMLPVVSAFCLERIRQWKGIAYQAIMILLLLVFIHNFPALITRFTAFNPLLIK